MTLYGFTAEYARALQNIARDNLSSSPTGVSDFTRRKSRSAVIYIVETPEAGIPAATDSGGFVTPGSATCDLLRREVNPDHADYQKIVNQKDTADANVTVTVFNHSTAVIASELVGSQLYPVDCHMDRWGTLWAFPGKPDTICEEFNDLDVIAAADVDTIDYILGVDDMGVCFRVPVSDCDPMTEHS